jgi:hypothetical protein
MLRRIRGAVFQKGCKKEVFNPEFCGSKPKTFSGLIENGFFPLQISGFMALRAQACLPDLAGKSGY